MKKRMFNTYKQVGTMAVVDISTKKFPKAEMKIDLDVWLDLLDQGIGRCSDNGAGYAQTNFNGKQKQIHKIITPHFNLTVDHINHDKLDNRLSNLRDASYEDQAKNNSLRKTNKTGVSGVIAYAGKKATTWRVRIRAEGKNLALGTFKTLAKATAVRKAAEVKYGYHPLHGAK